MVVASKRAFVAPLLLTSAFALQTSSKPSSNDVVATRGCNSDSDCFIHSDKAFRCMDAGKLGLNLLETAQNSCRLPGNGPKPNSTCVCQDLGGAGNGGCFPIKKEAADASKPQYLMIGDCITAWVKSKIGDRLEEKGWEVVRANEPSNAASVNLGIHCVDGWLPTHRKWDVISFSFGLHDVSHNTEHLTLDQYVSLLTKFTEKMVNEQKRSGAKLLFANTLPVPNVPTIDSPECTTKLSGAKCLMPPRFDSEVVEHNAAAEKVMKSFIAEGAQIEILDVYSKFAALCGGVGYSFCNYQMEYNVHPSPEGNDKIGEWFFEKLSSMMK
eukprot:TRINITY_DN15511_c0_g2_i1.p1 TRINITY_DN15511_c0_g2~~TRINITY_DN15511_c0_g2_i1.p1  ORF type:complete len:326 (-),score=53.24 TRINITY_DN15511_c0_g2_i1:64-1041(-)